MSKRVLPLFAAAALLALLATPAASAVGERLDVNVVSLRQIEVTLVGGVPGPAADVLRASVDGDRDGKVSSEEYAVYISAFEVLAFAPVPSANDLYGMVWEFENSSGAAAFTPEGRFGLGANALAQAESLRITVAIDGEAGAGRVSYLTMSGLAGPVLSNASVSATMTMRYDWERSFSSYGEHLIVMGAPPALPVRVALPGGFVAENFTGVTGAAVSHDGSVAEGTTTDTVAVVKVSPRGGSFEAFVMVVALVAGSAVVVTVAAVSAGRHRETEVEPAAKASETK